MSNKSLHENVTALKESIITITDIADFKKNNLCLCHTFLKNSYFCMYHKGKTSINISFLLIFFLETSFVESSLNLIDTFQGRPQGLQFKGFNLRLLMIGSSLKSSVMQSFTRSSLESSLVESSLGSLMIGSFLRYSV